MRCRLHCVLFLGLFTWTTSQNTSDETNDSNDSNDSNTTDNATLEDGSLGVSVTCYPEEDILLGNPATCVLKGDLVPVQDWDKLSFGILQTEVLCRDYDEIAPCNVSDDVVYENGWPVHIDVVESFRNGGPGDWVQLVALGMAAWWAVGLIVGLGACYRWWDLDPPASRDALLQGFLRQLVAMSLGILWYLSAWGSPRRGGWFYAPYCPNSEHKEMFRLGFSFWCFANSGLTHAILCMGGAVFHTIFILRSLYPENIIFLPSSEVPKFLETVLEASPVCNSLHYEEADVAFTWENGRTDDLRLKSWKQELCKRSNNCLTLEIHIRPADTFSTGSIQSLGYAFYLRLKDMRPIKEGSVQVYQALVRSSWLFRSRAGVGIFLERFVTNLLMLGLAHEAYFQHFGVDSACLRLEKRVRLLPEEELEKLCGDCFTLGTSHLSRVKDFKARAMRGVAEAETQVTPLQAADGEDSIKRALSVRSREKNEMMRVQGLNSESAWSRQADIPSDHESDRDAPTSSDEEAEASPLRPSCSDITPSRLGMPALLDVACEAGGGRVPANSPAASTASLSRPSAHRFARGAASKEDWTRLVHKANTFILRSYVAMAEREPITKYVEEATRAFLDAWEFGSLKEDPIAAHLVLDKVRSQYNKHLSKALACLDLQSVDDLRAAAEGSAGSGPEIQLMDPAVMKMMTCHSRYLLQMAMAIGDRKALALALVESCRLMGDLPDAALWQPAVDPRPEDDGEEAQKEEDRVSVEAPVAPEGPEEEEEGALQGTLAGPCAFDGGPGLPEGELQCRPNTPTRSIDSADLVLADPGPLWSSLHRSFAEGAGPATPLPARSCAQLLQMAREMYRQKLFDESQQLLLTEAARELLGDGLDHFGESWMQQQLSVMRSKQVGSLDPRSKRELESPKFIRSLQALFDLTTRQVITRDRQGKLPTRLKVVKAKRSVNLDAYRAYYARRAEIEQALAQPAPGAETATRLDDCLTIGPTGCYLSRELRLMQGVWLDADTGSRWLIDGDQVYRVPVLAAQLLDPTKAAAIHDSEDVQQLRPVQQPVVVSVEVSGPAEMRPRVPQFAREIRKRAKDDEDCEENPQDKMPVKATYHGWLDESGMRVTWRCQKTATFFSWEREASFQGVWRIAGSYCLLMHVDAFREGAKHLDSRKSRLGKVSRSRRGEAWFDREIQKLCEEGRDCGEAQAPTFLMHLVGELFPIWTDMSPNIMTFRSTTFKGFVNYEGQEICAEPMSESERPRMSAFRPRRTLLGRRTTHVVQPFLSKTWGYRESATVDLSAKELNLKANELWLFHGTRESAAESITENEFQLKMAGTNRGTMFGPGIYMADAVTKSDEYTEPDPTGLRTMILCRCTMGRAIKQFEGGRECMKACHAGGFHSVKGLRAYNEYIVYDENQVYAEYIIWYRRVYNIE